MARIARVIATGFPHHITQGGNRRRRRFLWWLLSGYSIGSQNKGIVMAGFWRERSGPKKRNDLLQIWKSVVIIV